MSDIIETPIADLVADERCQARECMNWDAVGDYRAAYEAGESLPTLEVFGVDGELIIVDGFHRHEAATRAGVALLPVTVVAEGSMAEAIREALGKNHRHGVQRTQKDKRKAVRMALALDDDMSNRGIATLCNVSHTLVANVRNGRVEQLELTMPEPGADELGVAFEKARAATPLEDGAGIEECLRLWRKRAERITAVEGRCEVCGSDAFAGVSAESATTRIYCLACLDELRATTLAALEPAQHPVQLEAAE